MHLELGYIFPLKKKSTDGHKIAFLHQTKKEST